MARCSSSILTVSSIVADVIRKMLMSKNFIDMSTSAGEPAGASNEPHLGQYPDAFTTDLLWHLRQSFTSSLLIADLSC
jgi:hypothetical protein